MWPVDIPCAAAVRGEMAGARRKAVGVRSIQALAGLPTAGVCSILYLEIHCALPVKGPWREISPR